MLQRKLNEIGSCLYRSVIYPFVRMGIERRTKSILKQKSYLMHTTLCGRNFVGKGTVLKNAELGYGSYINAGGDLTNTRVGKYTSIGTNVSTVLGRHPVKKQVAMHPAFYSAGNEMGFTYTGQTTFEESGFLDAAAGIQVIIGNDVWIGNEVKLMEGVTIGDGAVIGAGAIVTKDVAPYSINVGIPAKQVDTRFTAEQIEKLLKFQWWNQDEDWIREHIAEFSDIEKFSMEE